MSEKQTNKLEVKEHLGSIKEFLERAEELVDENFAIQHARNDAGELSSVKKLSDAEMEEEFRHRGEFLLPDRTGRQTLEIHLLAADPYAGSVLEDSDYADYGPDAIAKIVHSRRGEDGKDSELKETYVIRKVPDGDLILEKSLYDETESNRDFSRAREFAKRKLGIEAVHEAVSDYALRRKDRVLAAKDVMLEESQLGLHFASDEDRDNLQDLLDEAELKY